jgi:hypothetical protein
MSHFFFLKKRGIMSFLKISGGGGVLFSNRYEEMEYYFLK